MKIKKALLSILGVLTLSFSVGCSNTEETKVELQNTSESKEVVVATSVAVTEILDALGVRVSGVPTTSYELPESTKDAVKVGQPMSPDLEIIKSLNPTCVVSVDTLGSDYENLFVENNIPSEFVNLQNLDGLKEAILNLGKRFDKFDEANKILQDLEDKQSEVKNNSKTKESQNVLIIFGAPGSMMVATDNSYVGNLVEIAGGNNIFKGTNSSFMQVNMEEIIKSNPDKILVMTHGVVEDAKKHVQDELSKNTSWKNVKAVKNNEVHYLENEYFGMSANLHVMEALEKLGVILYE